MENRRRSISPVAPSALGAVTCLRLIGAVATLSVTERAEQDGARAGAWRRDVYCPGPAQSRDALAVVVRSRYGEWER